MVKFLITIKLIYLFFVFILKLYLFFIFIFYFLIILFMFFIFYNNDLLDLLIQVIEYLENFFEKDSDIIFIILYPLNFFFYLSLLLYQLLLKFYIFKFYIFILFYAFFTIFKKTFIFNTKIFVYTFKFFKIFKFIVYYKFLILFLSLLIFLTLLIFMLYFKNVFSFFFYFCYLYSFWLIRIDRQFYNFFYRKDFKFYFISKDCNSIYTEETRDLCWHDDYNSLNTFFGDEEDPILISLIKIFFFDYTFFEEYDLVNYSYNELEDFDIVILPICIDFPDFQFKFYFYHYDGMNDNFWWVNYIYKSNNYYNNYYNN